jgi:predicted ATPase
MLKTLAVANYRSINKWVIPLGRLNLITGPNGSGKSNLYRALRAVWSMPWPARVDWIRPSGPPRKTSSDGCVNGELAPLIIRASEQCQVWVVSHARRLISALQEDPECNCIVLEKTLGQTGIVGQRMLDEPAWYWPD